LTTADTNRNGDSLYLLVAAACDALKICLSLKLSGGIGRPKKDQPASKDEKKSSNREKSPSESANNEVSRAWFALSLLYHTICSFYDVHCLQNWEKMDSGR
jgi:hypothetical protein